MNLPHPAYYGVCQRNDCRRLRLKHRREPDQNFGRDYCLWRHSFLFFLYRLVPHVVNGTNVFATVIVPALCGRVFMGMV